MLSVEAPWMLLALPLPWLVRRLLPPAPMGGAIALPIAGELHALEQAGQQGVAGMVRRLWLPVLAWLLLLVAACQPQWLGEPVTLPASGRDLMLAVDVSGSMDEADMTLGLQRVNRLQAVQGVAADFIQRREGDRIGLILFGRQAYIYAPLSLDRPTIASLLGDAEVGLAGQETAIGDAIALGVKHLRDSPAGERVLVLLTDGVNTAGNIEPDKAAELAATAGVRVHTIGFGSERTNRGIFQLRRPQLDEAQLNRIAQTTGGRYFRARDTGDLERIYALLDEIEPVQVDERVFRPRKALFHWPLGAALLIAGLLMLPRARPAPMGAGA